MRLLLAFITIGAAGIGYVVIQRSESHSTLAESQPRALFDWSMADDPVKVVLEDGLSIEPLNSSAGDEGRKAVDSSIEDIVSSNLVPEPELPSSPNSTRPDAATTAEIVSSVGVLQTQHAEIETSPNSTEKDLESAVVSPNEPADIGTGPTAGAVIETTEVSNKSVEVVDNSKTVVADPATVQKSPPTATPVSDTTTSQAPVQAAVDPSVNHKIDEVSSRASSTSKNATELLPGKVSERGKKVVDSGWTMVAKSIQELPMHTRHYGTEGNRTLVIAGLDGKDSVAVRWNDQLANSLASQTELFPANEIHIFRAGNPDGLVKGTSTNSHGVLINRNFPSRRYQQLTDKTSGPGPVSESETRAILDAMYTFRPRRVIHLMSTTGKSKVLYNPAAKATALELERDFKIEIQPLDVELVPGSLEDFSDGTLDAAVMTMQLSTGKDWQLAGKKHLPSVLAAINGRSLAKVRSVSGDTANTNSARIPAGEITPAAVPKVRRGYEELPPPPR